MSGTATKVEYKNTFSDVITFYDLRNLPHSIIVDIATALGEDTKGLTKNKLVELIWEGIKEDKAIRNQMLKNYEDELYTNKVTLSYYKAASFLGLKNKIIQKEGKNVIDGTLTIDEEAINTMPKLHSIAEYQNDFFGEKCFIIRYLYQDGYYNIPTPNGNQQIKKIRTLTAYVDEENGILEVRAPKSVAKKVASSLASYYEDNPEVYDFAILGNHGGNSENLAKSLEGHLLESSGEPTLSLNEVTDEQVMAIKSILTSIDTGLSESTEEIDYEKIINDAKEILFSEQEPVPFLALILAGLDKVSLKTFVDSLLSSPLYSSLSPYLTNRGGYISFYAQYKNIKNSYTIQVATISNTIYFPGNTNEVAIGKLRKAVYGI
ncbi:hypothetical protein HA908_000004 [Enterococcus faecium]|nr:hypothetical protein [Enterococcus faecium]